MAEQQMSMPGVFGGLMRYNEEYKSKLMLKPGTAIAGIIAFGILILILNMVFVK